MPKTEEQAQRSEGRAIRLAGAAFVFFAVASTAFALSYTTAATLTRVPQSQAAAAAAPQTPAADRFASVALLARSAIVVDATDGRALFALNPDAQLPLASITKVAMALTVSEALRPDDVIIIPRDTVPTADAPSLRAGERWTENDLLDYTLTASSNDGANILAAAADANLRALYPQAPAGGAALWRMNDLARQLGLTGTFFLNVNGLDISSTQSGAYGSARDVSKLLTYAATSAPAVFDATTRRSVTLTAVTGEKVTATNTNEALPSIPGLVMGKTGYTDLAGGNLGVVFDDEGHRIVAVVLGSTLDGRFSDMASLVAATQRALGAQ